MRSILGKILRSKPFWPLCYSYCGPVTALMYHSITEEKLSAEEFFPNRDLSIELDQFEQQMAFLAKNYKVLAMQELLPYLESFSTGRRGVVITFDDGYLDNFKLALPILEKYRLPATIFVTTGLLDGEASLWWYELREHINSSNQLRFSCDNQQYEYELATLEQKEEAHNQISNLFFNLKTTERKRVLERIREGTGVSYNYREKFPDWQDLKEFARHDLITIGAHTVTHPVLACEAEEDVRREVKMSRDVLEDRLGMDVKYFAYPYGFVGACDTREYRIVEELGFELAFTTRFAHIHKEHLQHKMALPRVIVRYTDSLTDFRRSLSGVEAAITSRGKRVVV